MIVSNVVVICLQLLNAEEEDMNRLSVTLYAGKWLVGEALNLTVVTIDQAYVQEHH